MPGTSRDLRQNESATETVPRSRFSCLPDIGRAAHTAHFLDLDAVEHRDRRLGLAANLGCRISTLPPQ